MVDERTKLLFSREEQAVRARIEREGLWRILQNFVRPTSLTYEEKQENADPRERRLLESTAAVSLELFASFLMSAVLVAGTAGSAAFRLAPASATGRPLSKEAIGAEFKEWQETAVSEIRHVMFTGPQGGTEVLHNVCLDLGWIGTGCFAIWEAPGKPNPVRWEYYPAWAVSGELGENGNLAAVYIAEKMPKRQAMRRWPESADIIKAQGGDEIELLYAAFSADDPDIDDLISPQDRARAGRWYGMWVMRNPRVILSTAAYMEQPVFMPSWYRVDKTVWGRSPAMTALGDTITANALTESVVRGTEKLVDPPWQAMDGALLSPLRAFPGGITYTDGEHGLSPLLPPGASRIELGNELRRDLIARIEKAFFLHLFQDQNPTGSKQPRTAYEVAQSADERNRAVSPMVQRLQARMIDPMVWRILGILVRNGTLAAPPLVEGRRLVLVHRSPIVASQQQLDALNIMRWIEGSAFVAQADPSALDWIDGDECVRRLHEGSGSPIGTLRRAAAVEALREARQQREAVAAAVPAAAVAGDTMAKLLTAQRR